MALPARLPPLRDLRRQKPIQPWDCPRQRRSGCAHQTTCTAYSRRALAERLPGSARWRARALKVRAAGLPASRSTPFPLRPPTPGSPAGPQQCLATLRTAECSWLISELPLTTPAPRFRRSARGQRFVLGLEQIPQSACHVPLGPGYLLPLAPASQHRHTVLIGRKPDSGATDVVGHDCIQVLPNQLGLGVCLQIFRFRGKANPQRAVAPTPEALGGLGKDVGG